jgi:hypothetical protein
MTDAEGVGVIISDRTLLETGKVMTDGALQIAVRHGEFSNTATTVR